MIPRNLTATFLIFTFYVLHFNYFCSNLPNISNEMIIEHGQNIVTWFALRYILFISAVPCPQNKTILFVKKGISKNFDETQETHQWQNVVDRLY